MNENYVLILGWKKIIFLKIFFANRQKYIEIHSYAYINRRIRKLESRPTASWKPIFLISPRTPPNTTSFVNQTSGNHVSSKIISKWKANSKKCFQEAVAYMFICCKQKTACKSIKWLKSSHVSRFFIKLQYMIKITVFKL